MTEDSVITGIANPDKPLDPEVNTTGEYFDELIRTLREITVREHDKPAHIHLSSLFLKAAEGAMRDFDGDHVAWLTGRSLYHLEMAKSISQHQSTKVNHVNMSQPHSTSQEWEYFLGRTANLHSYPRRGVQWFHEHGDQKWHPCFEDVRHGERISFLPEVKYRRKISVN